MSFERPRRTSMLALTLAFACSACSDSGPVSPAADTGVGGPEPQDAGEQPDFGVFDQGEPDIEDVGPADAGPVFDDPAALFQGRRSIANSRMQILVRGTASSTKTPILVLSHGPSVGYEYFVEPLDFLLGPGGVDDPDRLVFFIDLPGAGRSDEGSLTRPDVTIENQYAFLIQAIETYFHTFDNRPFDVIGHHFGGLMATLLANRRPELVEDMLLIAPYPLTREERQLYVVEYQSALLTPDLEFINDLQGVPRCLFDPNQCALEVFRIYQPTWECESVETLGQLDIRFVSAGGGLEFNPRNYYPGSIIESWRNEPYDLADEAPGVQARVTMLVGGCDLIPERSLQLYDAIPDLTRIDFEDSGRFMMVEEPERFRTTVLDALDSENF